MTDQGNGQQNPFDSTSAFNVRQFQIDQTLSNVSTAKPVQVLAVNKAAMTVDVQIMTNQLDGANNATPHGTIYDVPYTFMQLGTSAVRAAPGVGDKGLMVCCDRDISAVKSTKAIANPGTLRKFDPADGIYIGGIPMISAAPDQVIDFTDTGITIQDKNSNSMIFGSSGINLNGLIINQQGQVAGPLPVTGSLELGGTIQSLSGTGYTGNITTTGTIQGGTVTNGTVGLASHHHVAPSGGGNTGPAQP